MARFLRSHPAGTTHTRLRAPAVVTAPPVLGAQWKIKVVLTTPAQQRTQILRRGPHSFFVRPPRIVTAPPVLGEHWKLKVKLVEPQHTRTTLKRRQGRSFFVRTPPVLTPAFGPEMYIKTVLVVESPRSQLQRRPARSFFIKTPIAASPRLGPEFRLVVVLAALAVRAQFKRRSPKSFFVRPPTVVTAPPVLGANWRITHAAILPRPRSATKLTSRLYAPQAVGVTVVTLDPDALIPAGPPFPQARLHRRGDDVPDPAAPVLGGRYVWLPGARDE